MTIEDLARQLGDAARMVVPQASFRARVKLRVLEAIEPQSRPGLSWLPVFLRSVTGTLAVLVLVAGGTLFVYQNPSAKASYIGEVELLAGIRGKVEIIRYEEGKEPTTESIEQHTEVKKVKIRAGDVIRTSSGSTIALRFDNHSSAVIKDVAVLTVGGVTAKNAQNEPTTVAVVLEKGTIETDSQTSEAGRGNVLEVQTSSKTVETSDIAVAVSVGEGGETDVAAVYPDDPRIRTLDLGYRVIIGADLSVPSENVNASSPTPSPTYVWIPPATPSPSTTPSPTPTTGSGDTIDKNRINIVIPIRLK